MTAQVLRATFVSTLVLSLSIIVGCGGGDQAAEDAKSKPGAPDPAKAATAKLPDFNPDAQYNGKTARAYAVGLTDLNREVQARALADIAKFKTDGLAVRDEVRAVVDGNADPEVKVMAMAVLHEMSAPEAPALVRQKLVDPTFSPKSDTPYRGMLEGMKDLGIDEAVLRDDMMKLAASNPEHAERLMMLRRLPTDIQTELTKKVFEGEHSDQARRFFFTNLPNLQFLDDAQRIAFIRKNLDLAAQPSYSSMAQNMLLNIGTEEAMTVALSFAGANVNQRYALMNRFAQAKVDPLKVMDMMGKEAKAAFDGQSANLAASQMESLAQSVLTKGRQEEALRINEELREQKLTPAEAQEARQNMKPTAEAIAVAESFVTHMGDMMKNGPTDDHRVVGLSRLMTFARPAFGLDDTMLLEPVFALIADTSAPEAVRGSALQQLQQNGPYLAQRADAPFYHRCVKLMADPLAADAMTKLIVSGVQRRHDMMPVILEAVAADAEAGAYATPQTLNPAAAVLLQIASYPPVARTPQKEKASIVLGKMLVSEHVNPQYLGSYIQRHRHVVATLDQNTVAGTIGFLEPVIFSDGESYNAKYYPQWVGSALYVRAPGWFADEPAEKEKWVAFLQRVSAEAKNPEHRKYADAGLKHMAQ